MTTRHRGATLLRARHAAPSARPSLVPLSANDSRQHFLRPSWHRACTVTCRPVDIIPPTQRRHKGRKTVMVMENERIGECTGRIRAEFLEMPGLTLTRWQIRRLWLL